MANLAIVFYGHVRSFRNTFENFKKNVLDVNLLHFSSVDIFISTWNILEHLEPRQQYVKDVEVAGKSLTKNDFDFIQSRYNPVSLQVFEPLQLDHPKKSFLSSINYDWQHFHVIFNVSFLLQSAASAINSANKNYDNIILTRMDIDFKKQFNLKPFTSTSGILPQFRFSKRQLSSAVFYPFVQDCPNLIRSPFKQVTAIDLLAIYPANFFVSIFHDCHKDLFNSPPAGIEGFMSRLILTHGGNLFPMYFEKPTCFNILRTNAKL